MGASVHLRPGATPRPVRHYWRSRRGRRRAACAIAWVESGEVISRNRITSAALVMISALPLAADASSTRMTAGAVATPAGGGGVGEGGGPRRAAEAPLGRRTAGAPR